MIDCHMKLGYTLYILSSQLKEPSMSSSTVKARGVNGISFAIPV